MPVKFNPNTIYTKSKEALNIAQNEFITRKQFNQISDNSLEITKQFRRNPSATFVELAKAAKDVYPALKSFQDFMKMPKIIKPAPGAVSLKGIFKSFISNILFDKGMNKMRKLYPKSFEARMQIMDNIFKK